MEECDLYEPVRDFLLEQGFAVRGEVHGCDITASKGEILLVVELKLRLNLELLLQAVDRQKKADLVYVAVPKFSNLRTSRWRRMRHLLQRLELGLLFVSCGSHAAPVEVVLDAKLFDRYRSRQANRKHRELILQELWSRTADYNQGGSVGKQLMTAYRETCLHIACGLEELEQASPAELRALGTGPKTQSILAKNYYGWFQRVSYGVYRLTAAGLRALEDHRSVVEHYRQSVRRG